MSSSSYYNIDTILTDAQTLPCTFALSVPGLGHLDNNSGGDLKQSTTLSLPLYLAEMLAISPQLGTSRLITLDLPAALSPRVLNALTADPLSVDLRALAPHFYGLGARVLELFEDEELVEGLDARERGLVEGGVLEEVLVDTFKRRAKEIADHAHNSRGAVGGEGAEFLRGLDEAERRLFRAAHDGAKAVRVWMGEMKKT